MLRFISPVVLFLLAEPLLAQTVSITNLTRGGSSSFLVGDAWRILIAGPPNQEVVNAAFQNGMDLGSTAYGFTNENGEFTQTGIMPGWAVGHWIENWSVGGVHADPTLEFDIYEGCDGIFTTIPPTMYSTDNFRDSDQSYLYTFPSGSATSQGTITNAPSCVFIDSRLSPLSSPNFIAAQTAFFDPYQVLWLVSDNESFTGFYPRCYQCFYPIIQFGDFEYVTVDPLLNVYFFYSPISLWIDRSTQP